MRTGPPRVSRLPGNALLFVVMISLIVTILIGSFAALTHMRSSVASHYLHGEQLEQNLESALILGRSVDFPNGESLALDLFDQGRDSVQINSQPWGHYQLVAAKAWRGNRSLLRTETLAARPSATERNQLVVYDLRGSLQLVGEARLQGVVRLPEPSLRPGNLEGQNYRRNQLIEGRVLPLGNSHSLNWDQKTSDWIDALFRLSPLPAPDQSDTLLGDPFGEPAVYEMVSFQNLVIRGPVIFVSPNPVVLEGPCDLENVIVVAPSIRIEGDFRGSIQAFARDSLVVEGRAVLYAPSSVTVWNERPNGSGERVDHARLRIEENARVEGIVALRYGSGDRTAYVQIDKEAQVWGQVIADGYLQLQGMVYGQVLARMLLYRGRKGGYEGVLLDGQCLRPKPGIEVFSSKLIQGSKEGLVLSRSDAR